MFIFSGTELFPTIKSMLLSRSYIVYVYDSVKLNVLWIKGHQMVIGSMRKIWLLDG